ncbi:MAG: TRAP transporter small permease [Chloroflexota bacterium]
MLSKIGKWYSEFFLYKGALGLTVIARITLIVMMVINVMMVTIRKVLVVLGWTLGGGIIGAYEITQMSMVVLTACACAYTWYSAGHIRIGLFRDGMKPRNRDILDAVVTFVGAAYIAILVWGLLLQTISFITRGGTTQIMRLPLTPFAIIFVIVMAHVFLVLSRSLVGLVSKAMGKKFAAEPYLKTESRG